jgi:hypothetical protein
MLLYRSRIPPSPLFSSPLSEPSVKSPRKAKQEKNKTKQLKFKFNEDILLFLFLN